MYDHSDAALGACVLAAGIPVTYHPGIHFDFRHPTLLEHHPPAPFLGTHQHHAFLSDGHRWALRVNPAGFAQQARVVVERPPDAATKKQKINKNPKKINTVVLAPTPGASG
jgi:hypothetical protein